MTNDTFIMKIADVRRARYVPLARKSVRDTSGLRGVTSRKSSGDNKHTLEDGERFHW